MWLPKKMNTDSVLQCRWRLARTIVVVDERSHSNDLELMTTWRTEPITALAGISEVAIDLKQSSAD